MAGNIRVPYFLRRSAVRAATHEVLPPIAHLWLLHLLQSLSGDKGWAVITLTHRTMA